ncbi:MAG: DVUA0089 family protein [Bryobacteraceae bacterium]
MKHTRNLLLVTLTLGLLAPISRGASITRTYTGALPVTLTGTLPNQGTALEQTFTLPSLNDLTISTSSYAMGGFQSNLFLYDSTGSFIAGGVPAGFQDPGTGLIGDMSLMMSGLPAGMYTVALTDFLLNQSLTATNLSDGFTTNFGSGTTFADANGNTRTGSYALTISVPDQAAIPEPATLWLAAPVVAWIGMRARKRPVVKS